jgi:hypothetical protein
VPVLTSAMWTGRKREMVAAARAGRLLRPPHDPEGMVRHVDRQDSSGFEMPVSRTDGDGTDELRRQRRPGEVRHYVDGGLRAPTIFKSPDCVT